LTFTSIFLTNPKIVVPVANTTRNDIKMSDYDIKIKNRNDENHIHNKNKSRYHLFDNDSLNTLLMICKVSIIFSFGKKMD